MDLKRHIRDVPDFPKPGILFKDITPLLADADAFRHTNQALAEGWSGVTKVAGIESRGFLFGVGVSQLLGVGFIPIRKKGKLPAERISYSYALEYGEDTVEVHADSMGPGDQVLIIDDLLATGGTLEASCHLVEKTGAKIAGCAVVIELLFLKGREKIKGHPFRNLIEY